MSTIEKRKLTEAKCPPGMNFSCYQSLIAKRSTPHPKGTGKNGKLSSNAQKAFFSTSISRANTSFKHAPQRSVLVLHSVPVMPYISLHLNFQPRTQQTLRIHQLRRSKAC
ncbi:hypothetical protein ANPL_03045 [Anaplasma platys]|uniref:Uncharacterized protein n=1 Tax=Anaplasma platys TaxID=949 RepID=A0A858PYM2_9RICK|nr:hypothetical protein ANPL_03045 [Anaplasma platys]